jgi:hypothetical protein
LVTREHAEDGIHINMSKEYIFLDRILSWKKCGVPQSLNVKRNTTFGPKINLL